MDKNLIDLKQKIPSIAELEEAHILNVLELCEYKRNESATVLGICKETLWYKICKLEEKGHTIPQYQNKKLEIKHQRKLFPTNKERLAYYNDIINRDFL
jgi:predicted DNA-binding protein (UPF0251 family)